ncbi:hypothetical protein VTK73DRAFT_871 [Phialemonium thermophilum]|uniref:Clr5 domain-containing protein n=1 Tax=Phialemonium thermophilum TaxID=223376 RepID=A0ABR3Y4C0_9PEZI
MFLSKEHSVQPLSFSWPRKDSLPSITELGIDPTQDAKGSTHALPHKHLQAAPILRESRNICDDSERLQQSSYLPRSAVRLPSFSELEAKIASVDPEWQWDRAALRRRSSCESNASVPSLAHSASGASSPASSPRTPPESLSTYTFHHLPQPYQYGAKFHLNSAPEYWFAQAKGFDSRSWYAHGGTSPPRHYRPSPVSPGTREVPRGQFRDRNGSVGKRPSVSKTPHINKEYTLEQNFWIIYNHVDLKKPWKEVEDEFGRHFGIKVKRTDGGLQSTYYRWNEECPVIDENGLLQYGEGEGYNRWGVKTYKAKVRGFGKVSLIDRYATEVAEAGYSWILPHDMMRARELAERRRPYREAFEAKKKARLQQSTD